MKSPLDRSILFSVKLLDDYLAELSKIYSSENNRLLPISEVIDRLLDIRNSIPEFFLDGDEAVKYFNRQSSKND